MTEFFRTRLGQRYYESTLPKLVDQIGRLADGIATLNETLAQPAVTRRNWYQEREPGTDEHPIDVEVRDSLRDHAEAQALRAQIRECGKILTELLDGETLELWLRLEAAFNDYRAITAEAYFNAGLDAGLAMRVVADAMADDPKAAP